MKCSVCGKEGVIYRRYEGIALCKHHFLRNIEKVFVRTIRKYSLIERGEKIAVALSGGKDSSVLLYLLKKYEKKYDIEIEAILVDEGIKGYREKTRKDAECLTSRLGISLHVVSFKDILGKSLDEAVAIAKEKRAKIKACTICGVLRRYALDIKAREIGADKLAVGHNLDDEAQSILSNYLRGDLLRLARLGPRPYIIEGIFVQRIKPLLFIPEKEVALYGILQGLAGDFDECPYASFSFRWDVRSILNDLEKKYAGIKFNLVRTYEKIMPCVKEMLPKSINKCAECGMPTSRNICKVCEIKKIL